MQTDMILISEDQARLFQSFGVEVDLRYAVPRKIVEAFAALAEPVAPAPAQRKRGSARKARVTYVSVSDQAERVLKGASGKTRIFCQHIINCANGSGKFSLKDTATTPVLREGLVGQMVKSYGYAKTEASWLMASAIKRGVLKGIVA